MCSFFTFPIVFCNRKQACKVQNKICLDRKFRYKNATFIALKLFATEKALIFMLRGKKSKQQ